MPGPASIGTFTKGRSFDFPLVIKLFTGIIIYLVIAFSSCSQKKDSKTYVLSVNVEGIREGKALLLLMSDTISKGYVRVDSVKISNGKCSFKGNLSHPKMGSVEIYDNKSKFLNASNVFLENSDIQLKINILSGQTSIKGSEIQKIEQKYFFFWSKLCRSPNNDQEYLKVETIVSKNAQSYYMLIGINELSGFLPMKKIEKLFNILDKTLRESNLGLEISRQISLSRKLDVGNHFPHIVVTDVFKSETKVDVRKAKYVLVDLWASWCVPCIKEMPRIKAIYDNYSSKGFDVIGISIDDNYDYWKVALNRNDLPWRNYLDSRKMVRDNLIIKFIPQSYLLDSKGIIVAKNLSPDELNDTLRKLLR